MDKIGWYRQQKKGIEVIEPNNNLCGAYFADAEDSLLVLEQISGKWQVIAAYYACYNSVYALLMKAGIKCEIHDCTIKLMDLISDFDAEDKSFLSELRDKRIQNQYYLKREKLDDPKRIKSFVSKCKKIAEDLAVDEIRGKLNDK